MTSRRRGARDDGFRIEYMVQRPAPGTVTNGYRPTMEHPSKPMPTSIPNPGPTVQPPAKPKGE